MASKYDEYGIKYRVIKFDTDQYFLFPVSLVKGIGTEYGFQTEEGLFHFALSKDDFDHLYVVDNHFCIDELEEHYEYRDDPEYLVEYFMEDHRNKVIYIDARNAENKMVERHEIDLDFLKRSLPEQTYCVDASLPVVLLNEKALREMSSIKDLDQLRSLLEKYKRALKSFKEIYNTKGVTKLHMVNGKMESIDHDWTRVQIIQKEEKEERRRQLINPDITYKGLCEYLLERVFGHDEQIKTFAQKLYMNYTAIEGETVESILIVGPSGTGKTITVESACKYLGIPYAIENTSNLVPQGIKGVTLESLMNRLVESSHGDIEKAERGLIYLDEFDKLNEIKLDIKDSLRHILLTYTGGGAFTVITNNGYYNFRTSMLNKIMTGGFERIHSSKGQIGFMSQLRVPVLLGSSQEIEKKIIQSGYLTPEEITRIPTILGYNDLSREDKKRAIIEGKEGEFAKRKKRYKRQFGIDVVADDSFIEAMLDQIEAEKVGMRNVNNKIKEAMDTAENAIVSNLDYQFNSLILTRDTAENPKVYQLS